MSWGQSCCCCSCWAQSLRLICAQPFSGWCNVWLTMLRSWLEQEAGQEAISPRTLNSVGPVSVKHALHLKPEVAFSSHLNDQHAFLVAAVVFVPAKTPVKLEATDDGLDVWVASVNAQVFQGMSLFPVSHSKICVSFFYLTLTLGYAHAHAYACEAGGHGRRAICVCVLSQCAGFLRQGPHPACSHKTPDTGPCSSLSLS